jgi:hypothetical protein
MHRIQRRIAGDDHIGGGVNDRATSWRCRRSGERTEAAGSPKLTALTRQRIMIAGCGTVC